MSDYLQRDQKRLDGSHPFHHFPVHLYHASKPPIVANDHETEQNARADGYSEEYKHQAYPKHVPHPDGKSGMVLVNSADDEAALTKGAA